jgi:hypothetical protein
MKEILAASIGCVGGKERHLLEIQTIQLFAQGIPSFGQRTHMAESSNHTSR